MLYIVNIILPDIRQIPFLEKRILEGGTAPLTKISMFCALSQIVIAFWKNNICILH